jgi:hypothetical protein
MTIDHDVTRIVRSWLQVDEHESADRVLDNVLALLDATPQRRSWWPARRIAEMNNFAKLLIAAAAVVVVAVVGVNLLPRSGDNSVGIPAPSPSPTTSPTPSPAPTPSPTLAPTFPPAGTLSTGRYSMVREGVLLSIAVPSSGWTSTDDLSINKGEPGRAGGIAIAFWPSTFDNVYADSCAHTPLSPPPAHSMTGLAGAVAAMSGIGLVTEPTSVTVDGRPAQHLVFTIRDDIACDPQAFYLYYDDSTGGPIGGYRYASRLGATFRVWIIDVDGKLVWIDSETYKGAGPQPGAEIQQIIDSIQFE